MKNCECGCGELAPISDRTDPGRGYFKGQPMRYVAGHSNRGKYGPKANNWKGGVSQRADGYRSVRASPGADQHVSEHVLVVERAIGKPLRAGADVHHVDGDPSNNEPTNLVACQDRAYHMLLHVRQRALAACGNANWLKCMYCKQYDAPAHLHVTITRGGKNYHLSCAAAEARTRRQRRKEEAA